MQYIECDSCRLRLHSGLFYEEIERCPRCGATLRPLAPTVRERLLRAFDRRTRTDVFATDWERVTNAQYEHREYVSRELTDRAADARPDSTTTANR
jgi:hypothetical protein